MRGAVTRSLAGVRGAMRCFGSERSRALRPNGSTTPQTSSAPGGSAASGSRATSVRLPPPFRQDFRSIRLERTGRSVSGEQAMREEALMGRDRTVESIPRQIFPGGGRVAGREPSKGNPRSTYAGSAGVGTAAGAYGYRGALGWRAWHCWFLAWGRVAVNGQEVARRRMSGAVRQRRCRAMGVRFRRDRLNRAKGGGVRRGWSSCGFRGELS